MACHGTTNHIQYYTSTWTEQDKIWSHKIPYHALLLQQPTRRRIGINCVWCLETNKKCLILMSSFFIYVLIWWYFRCLSMKLNYGEIEQQATTQLCLLLLLLSIPLNSYSIYILYLHWIHYNSAVSQLSSEWKNIEGKVYASRDYRLLL